MSSVIKNHITTTLSIIVAILILSYTLFQLRHIIIGPEISLRDSDSGKTVSDPTFAIVGNARDIKEIKINDKVSYIDESGNFADIILLSPGYNIVTITGEDKFHRVTEKKIELVYQREPRATAMATSSKRSVRPVI